MKVRKTIMLDKDIDRKIRLIQAKKIQNSNKSISFSEVLNEILRKSIK